MLGRQWGSPGRTSFGHCGFLPASAELLRKVYLAGWLAGSSYTDSLPALRLPSVTERLLETQDAEDPGGPRDGLGWPGGRGLCGDARGRGGAPSGSGGPARPAAHLPAERAAWGAAVGALRLAALDPAALPALSAPQTW